VTALVLFVQPYDDEAGEAGYRFSWRTKWVKSRYELHDIMITVFVQPTKSASSRLGLDPTDCKGLPRRE
jgi:hypothetical protein